MFGQSACSGVWETSIRRGSSPAPPRSPHRTLSPHARTGCGGSRIPAHRHLAAVSAQPSKGPCTQGFQIPDHRTALRDAPQELTSARQTSRLDRQAHPDGRQGERTLHRLDSLTRMLDSAYAGGVGPAAGNATRVVFRRVAEAVVSDGLVAVPVQPPQDVRMAEVEYPDTDGLPMAGNDLQAFTMHNAGPALARHFEGRGYVATDPISQLLREGQQIGVRGAGRDGRARCGRLAARFVHGN